MRQPIYPSVAWAGLQFGGGTPPHQPAGDSCQSKMNCSKSLFSFMQLFNFFVFRRISQNYLRFFNESLNIEIFKLFERNIKDNVQNVWEFHSVLADHNTWIHHNT